MRLAVAFLILFLTSTGNAQTKEQAEAFVRHLYAGYEHPATWKGSDTLGRGATLFFSPSLLRLIRSDEHRAPGYAGKLGNDPICDCQDFDGLKLTRLSLKIAGSGKAEADLILHYPQPEEKKLCLVLLWTLKGWRIDDIRTEEIPSLRKLLQ